MELTEKLYEWGAVLVGYSDVTSVVPARYKELPRCITIGIRLSDFIVDEIDDKPTYMYFHHYRTLNSLLDEISLKCTNYIMQKGYNACPIAASQTVHDTGTVFSGAFQHKTGAVKAGLGYIGKSALFISNDYGPRVRLSSVLTDMPIDVRSGGESIGMCRECEACVKACPAGAILGNEYNEGMARLDIYDAQKCSAYMKANFNHIGRGSVCGICVKVCPKGEKRKK